MKRIDPLQVKLPPHLSREARRLAADADVTNPVSEPDARPLVQSTAIRLMRLGVVNKVDQPGVIQSIADQIHKILHLKILSKGNRAAPTNFAERINKWFVNHVRITDKGSVNFTLEVTHDEILQTPMRPCAL